MRWKLFTILSAVSTMLCVATAAMWVRSIGHYGGIDWVVPERHLNLYNINGVAIITFARDSITGFAYGLTSERGVLRGNTSWLHRPYNKCGFGFGRGRTQRPPAYFGNRSVLQLCFPYWLPALLFGVLPITNALRTFRRRRLIVSGSCRHCGYDLRATPDRCPECGRAVTTKCTMPAT
jgi:hypothetical protein